MSRGKKGYMVTIRDNTGRQQKFFSDKAVSHQQGNSLASDLIEHFVATNRAMTFTTTDVSPSNGDIDAVDVKWTHLDRLVW